jgi:hypothetical protein
MSLISYKKFKIALKNNFCTLIPSIHWKNILINHELYIVFQKLLTILALVLGFLSYGTLCNYSLIIDYDLYLISLYKRVLFMCSRRCST